MINEVWYVAVERFDSNHQGWEKYILWSGLTQLEEVISLDSILCPKAVTADLFTKEDWLYNVHEDFLIDYLKDADHLIKLAKGFENINILAVIRSPGSEVKDALANKRFAFCGYDLIDSQSGISSLVNCGGFPYSFQNDELSKYGLILTYQRAKEIQTSLVENYPDEPHAYCDAWAIWRLTQP